jgi:NAD(P)H dehydrogenase (quinone)
MRVLIVYAHPEPSSFNAAMVDVAVDRLRGAGHDVRVSDLYGLEFDAVSDRRNFSAVADPARFDQQVEERFAAAHDGFSSDIAEEMKKVAWCDLLVLQFPLWWMGMPAIMKGWIDRVFAIGFAYGNGRWFDEGWLAGKKAILSVTVGGPREAYTSKGMYGPLEAILRPIHIGILGFVGFSVLRPLVIHGPGRMSADERALALREFGDRLAHIDGACVEPQRRSSDYRRFVRNKPWDRAVRFLARLAQSIVMSARAACRCRSVRQAGFR